MRRTSPSSNGIRSISSYWAGLRISILEFLWRRRGYYEERRNIIQPVNLILSPGGAIVSVTYSSGPVGRVVAEDAISHIRFLQEKAKQS